MNLKKGILYVLIANIINLFINIFTGLVLPKILTIDTYANIKLFQLYITYIGILHLGFSDGMYLRIGGKNLKELNTEDVLKEFKTFKDFQVCVTILCIVLSMILKNKILFFCSLVILPINIGNYIRQMYQAIGQFKRYSKFMNINTVLIFFVNLFLLFIIKTDDYNKYIIAYIIAYIIYWIMIERETKNILGTKKVKSERKYLFEDIKNGILLMIGNFCNVIFTGIDRILVQNLMGNIQFAFYSFAVSIESLINIFITPISTVMYNYLCNNGSKENVLKIKKMILVFSVFITTIVFPAKYIVEIWIPKYQQALNVLFILIAAQCITIMVRCIHINLYKAQRKQNRYFIIMATVVVISVILNIIGYLASKTVEAIALATLITSIIWFVIGECDFKIYKMKIKEYMYLFVSMLIFLICGKIENSILGGIIHIIIITLLTLVLMKETIKNIVSESIGVIKSKFQNSIIRTNINENKED